MWHSVLRELRTLRYRAFVIVGAIALGVAAITSVQAVANSVRTVIKDQARPMMAGDLVVRSQHTIPEQVLKLLPLQQSQTREMATMVSNTNGEALLAECKAVSPSYPLYGKLELDPESSRALNDSQILVQGSLLRRLSVKLGEEIFINGQSFVIAGEILQEPDRMSIGLSSGPRVMMSLAGLERAGLEQFGSRISRRVQWTGNEEQLTELTSQLEALNQQQGQLRIQSTSDGNPQAARSVNNTEQFLVLIAMLAMLIGSIGVFQSLSVWFRERRSDLAVRRCLGQSGAELLRLYLCVVMVIALIGAGLGVMGSVLGVQLIFTLLESWLPFPVEANLSPRIALQGLGLGLAVSILAAALPLSTSLRISPLVALRADVEPPSYSNTQRVGLTLMMLTLSMLLVSWQLDSLELGAAFVLVLSFLSASLWGVARLASKVLSTLPASGWVLRHVMASFRRPGSGITGAIVALGLGIAVTTTIDLLQERLARQMVEVRPEKAPTEFFVDIQPDQWAAVSESLTNSGAEYLQSAPVVMGRLSKINGQPVSALLEGSSERERWSFTREQRLTYDTEIDPKDIVEGEFGADPAPNELCIELRYAQRLGIGVGDSLTFDVQGIPLNFQVTALRRIRWETMNINFFLVGEAGLLEDAPQFQLAAAKLSKNNAEQLQNKLVKQAPNVTVISVREILNKVSGLLDDLALAIRGLGLFSAGIGALILFGSMQTMLLQRAPQLRLYRLLGTTKKELRWLLIGELLLIGSLAGLLGVGGAWILSGEVLTRGFAMPSELSGQIALRWLAAGPLFAFMCGGILVGRALNTVRE